MHYFLRRALAAPDLSALALRNFIKTGKILRWPRSLLGTA